MAHVKIKPLLEVSSVGYDSVMEQTAPGTPEVFQKVMSKPEDYVILTKWGDKKLASGFTFKHEGKTKMLLEPHPVVSFFSIAHQFTKATIKLKDQLMQDADLFNLSSHEHLRRTSEYISNASIAVVFMFTSIETHLNMMMDAHQSQFRIDGAEISKEYATWLKFEDKIKSILPQINPKCFHVIKGHHYAHIKKLTTFRNNVMHFRMDADSKFPANKNFIECALKFDYEKALNATREFINYYYAGLIENCDCGKD